jgi:hypothetical protein
VTDSHTVEVTLRPATDEDRELLLATYASTRADELDQVEWASGQRDWFLRMQFDAQDREYRRANPDGRFDVVEVDGRPAGRLYVAPETCGSSTSRCCRTSGGTGSGAG